MPGHSVRQSTYYLVFAALAVLLVLTVAVADRDLGPLNITVAMAIATAKAVLIALFFMHLLYSPPLVRLVAVGSFVWLGILLTILMADYVVRGWGR
jgi:cytochrome c oxidase subunit 4